MSRGRIIPVLETAANLVLGAVLAMVGQLAAVPAAALAGAPLHGLGLVGAVVLDRLRRSPPGGGSILAALGTGTGAGARLPHPQNCQPGILARATAKPTVFVGHPEQKAASGTGRSLDKLGGGLARPRGAPMTGRGDV